MSNKIQIGITMAALVLTIGIASTSLITTSTFGQNLAQGNQTGNQTANQTSPDPAQIPGSASQGSSGSSGPPY
jgi:archaellin